MGVSRKRYTPGAWKHVQAPGIAGKSVSAAVFDSYKKYEQKLCNPYTDWRELYSKQVKDFDSLGRMNESSHATDAMRYAMEQQKRNQQMAIGSGHWHTGGTSTNCTFTGAASVSPEDNSRQRSRFWEREYSVKTNENIWKLNHKFVHEYLIEMSKKSEQSYHMARADSSYFDKIFGYGAYEAYVNGPVAKRPKVMRGAKPKLDKPRLNPWPLGKFKVPDGGSLVDALQAERDHAIYTPSKKFHLGTNETLLEALQRGFDVFTKGISMRVAKEGEFSLQGGGTLVIRG